MGILEDIDRAACDLLHNRVRDFYPVAKNFNIAANHNIEVLGSRFDVFSYTTRVAVVNKNENGDWETFVHRDAFYHSTTTSKHLRRFVSAMVGRVDWDALYKACNKACDDATINAYSNPWVNVSEVTQ